MLSIAIIVTLIIVQQISATTPNIIFVITDDQDVMLNSMQAMPQTLSRVAGEGITMENAFAATPVCCASRTETLTGRTFHNIEATTGQTACQHAAADYHMFDNAESLFQKFHDNGYITAAFGKVVNKVTDYFCNQQNFDGFDRVHLPCDYEDFYSTQYLNKYVDGTVDDTTHTLDENVYQTAMMGNDSVEFVREMLDADSPFIAWIGPYAPHTPTTPAAWYADEFDTLSLYETENFNQVCPNHHAPVGNNEVLSDAVQVEMLQLYKDRLRSLMSVDDMVGGIMDVLDEYGDDNTYIVFTSDHGYSIGQFALPCGKMQPYEQTVRIPLYIKGPGISGGSTSDKMVGNIDFLPTFLEMAGISYDEAEYDGRSMKSILEGGESYGDDWRDTLLLEFKSVGSFGITHCPIWWPADDGSVVPGQVIKPSSSLSGNLIDDVDTNNWRVLRIMDGTNNKYYGEFYGEQDEGFPDDPIDYEYFNLVTDPWQLTNAYADLTVEEQEYYHQLVLSYGACDGADECSPVGGQQPVIDTDTNTETDTGTDTEPAADTTSTGNSGKGQTKGIKPKAKTAASNIDEGSVDYFVEVVDAKDLEDMDTDFLWITNKNDVYVQIFGYGEDGEKVEQTSVINGNTEPSWSETFEFKNDEGNGEYQSFKFKLYDSDEVLGFNIFEDDFLGETDLFETSEIVECGVDYSKDMTVWKDEEESGTLFVVIYKEC